MASLPTRGPSRNVIFEDGGRYRRLLAGVDGSRRDAARGIHDVGEADHARDDLLDAFETPYGRVELATDACVGAGGHGSCQRAAGRIRGQRDATAYRELLDQHAPAEPGHLETADDAIERHEDVAAMNRSILERDIERQMASADLDTGRIARNQRTGDADVRLVANQEIGVEHPEGQPDDGRDRCQRDVALREVELESDDLAALIDAAAHHARVGDRGGVRAHARTGQRETGNLVPHGQARQVVILLFLGAVVHQQFGRPSEFGTATVEAQVTLRPASFTSTQECA